MTDEEIFLLKQCLHSSGESLYDVWAVNDLNSPSIVFSMIQQGYVELFETNYDGLKEEENFKKTTVHTVDELKDMNYWRHESRDGHIYYKVVATPQGIDLHKNDKAVSEFWKRKQREKIELNLEEAASKRKAREEVDDPEYLKTLVSDYFTFYHLQFCEPVSFSEDPDQYDRNWEVNELIYRDPDRGWKVTLELIKAIPCPASLFFLAAGPLEDMLKLYGSYIIDKFDDKLLQDPLFRYTLAGVWLDEDEDEAYSLLCEIDESWNDEYADCHDTVQFDHEDCKRRSDSTPIDNFLK